MQDIVRGWRYQHPTTEIILQKQYNVEVNGVILHRMCNVATGEKSNLSDEELNEYKRL